MSLLAEVYLMNMGEYNMFFPRIIKKDIVNR